MSQIPLNKFEMKSYSITLTRKNNPWYCKKIFTYLFRI